MKKIIALVAVLAIAVLMLAACGGNSIVGKWEASMMGVATMTLEFKSDNTYTMTMTSTVEGVSPETHNGSYKVDGNKITIDGTESEYKIDGNKLSLTVPSVGTALEFTRK
jgi:ABC-type glycerol-3-phosphate transport system substrate-binding protein